MKCIQSSAIFILYNHIHCTSIELIEILNTILSLYIYIYIYIYYILYITYLLYVIRSTLYMVIHYKYS